MVRGKKFKADHSKQEDSMMAFSKKTRSWRKKMDLFWKKKLKDPKAIQNWRHLYQVHRQKKYQTVLTFLEPSEIFTNLKTSKKKMKDAKDGCFTEFPSHMEDPFKENMMYKPRQKVVNTSGKLFYPDQGPKSTPQVSIINRNVNLKINKQNYKDSLNFMTYRLSGLTVWSGQTIDFIDYCILKCH